MEKCFTKYHNDKIYSVEYRNEFGKLHKEDGPAVIFYSITGNIVSEHYYINNKKIDNELQFEILKIN